jgi:glycosyltransferase involved in cell wall biosynthesis
VQIPKVTSDAEHRSTNSTRPAERAVGLVGPSLAILTQQVSHYHAARYRAAAEVFPRLTIISSMNDADFPEFLFRGVPGFDIVALFDGKSAYLQAIKAGKMWRAICAALDKLEPDLVAVAGWAFPESLGAIAWARRRGARSLMMSDSQHEDSSRYPLREFIKSRVVAACDAALVAGARQSDYIVSLGMPQARVFFGYDAIDNQHFVEGAERARACAAAFRARHGLPEHYVLASARFVAKKNLIRLVEAFARAIQLTQAPHSLIILGDGPGRTGLEASISASGLTGRIFLPGFKDYETLTIFYGLADAFAHISLAEQWGLVINEAAAAGLPLIVSRPCGAAAELVRKDVNGYLVDPTNTEEIARALGASMTATDDVRRAMGVESQRIVGHWGPERFAEGLRDASAAAFAIPIPTRRLALWDAILFRALSRRYISAVS